MATFLPVIYRMEYPNSKISKPIRRTIFIVFLGLFILISPAIIMYTSGYRYDWRRGLLRETGSINIDIEPSDAEVFLNDIKIKSKIPIRLSDLVPAKYVIRISAPGYHDWRKEIDVKSKQTVYIKEITMLKTGSPEMILPGDVEKICLSFDSTYLAYLSRQGNLLELRIKNLAANEEPKTIYRLPVSDNSYLLSWSTTGNYLVISDSLQPHQLLVLINAEQPEKQLDLIKKIKTPIEKYQWKDSGQPELYFSTKQNIMSVLPSTEQDFTLSKNVYLDWFMESGQLWTISRNTTTKKIHIMKDTLGFSSEFTPETSLAEAEQDLKILTAKNDQLLLKKADKPEVVFFIKDKKYNFNGEKFLISKYNDWWIIWTPWEIWTYSRGEEPNLLNRSGQQLQEVLPLDQHNTLALIWADNITALFPYYLVAHDLFTSSTFSPVVDPKNKLLYFAATAGEKKGIWKLDY